MVIKKRDFQKTAGLIQEFLSKLSCEEATAQLRDSMNLVLFYLQKYYKKLRSRSLLNGSSPRLNGKSLNGSLILNGGVSPVSPACGTPDQFEWKWYNLESPRLSASLGTNEFSSLPLVLQAAKSADLKLLKELIDKDPEVVQQVDGLGRNAAMYCVHGNTPAHLECLQTLITTDCNLDLQANDNTTALHVAAHVNNIRALTLLLHNKASLNVEDNQGRTPLHWAAASTSDDNVKLLLQVGGNLNAVDSEGLTPAMWACYFDQLQNLQFLQKALSRIDPEEDAILRDTDCYGQCVIHWAVKGVGSLQCLEAILTPQTAILRDSDGKTVLHTAAEKGNTAACEMILEVRGNLEGLLDTDNSKRTPVHLAAICGQGEVVNFFLDRGGDLLARDCFGATAVDYIHNKHLNYCGMVIRAHSHQTSDIQHQTIKNAFASTPSNIESQEGQTEATRHKPSAATAEGVNATRDDQQNRSSFHDQNCDVSELHGFDVQGGSGQGEDEQNTQNSSKGGTINLNNADNRDEQNTSSNTNKRQNTLTRQSGFHNESDSRHLNQAASFDLRTEDGNILVVVSNLDMEDQQQEIIDMEDGDIDCEQNLEYSSVHLQQGHGSASSIHSDPDNADNCSVSVALSVSSLGSDNEEVVHDEDIIDYQDESSKQKQTRGEILDSQAQIIPESHESTNPPSRQLPQDIAPSQKYPQKLEQLQMENNYVNTDNNVEYDHDNLAVVSKKKKDKTKKKKQKGPTVSEMSSPLPLPRGIVPPLSPPSFGSPGIAKLGVLDPRGIKPAPWELGSLGPLRQPPSELPSSSPGMGRHAEYSKGYLLGDVLDRNESAFERPRTPEPPRSPRDIAANQSLQPCPPSSIIGSQGTPCRGPMEVGVHDREMNHGPPGPFHGPLAHANGQALLKNMDIIGRGPRMESWPGKNVGGIMSHGLPGQPIQALHGPIPHPPQR